MLVLVVVSVSGEDARPHSPSPDLALSQLVSAVECDSLTSPSILIEPSCCHICNISAINTISFNQINPPCQPVSLIILLNG